MPLKKLNQLLGRVFVLLVCCVPALHAAESELAPLGHADDGQIPWLQPDTHVAAVLNLSSFWDGPEKDLLREVSGMHPFVMSWWLRDATSMTGLNPSDVTRLAIGFETPAGWVVAVDVAAPEQIDVLRDKLVSDTPATNLHGLTYFANENYALSQLRPQTAIVSKSPAGIRSVLSRLAAQPNQAVSLISSSDKVPLLDVYLSAAIIRGPLSAEAERIPPWLKSADSAKYLRLTIEPADDLTIRLVADFPDDAAAEEGVATLKELVKQLEKYFEFCQLNMPSAIARFETENPGANKLNPVLDGALKAARTGLNTAVVSRSGTTASAIATIQTPHPVTDAILLLSLSPRSAK